MTNFNPPIESRSTDELVLIAYSSEKDWQTEAISAAKNELNKRNISTIQQKELFHKIEESVRNENLTELKKRSVEDYTIFEMIFIVLRWPIYLFHDWGLKKDGFHLKFKRRIQLITTGIVVTALIFVWASQDAEIKRKERLKEIEAVDISDWEDNRIKK